jgi:rod shape determining protein RodA
VSATAVRPRTARAETTTTRVSAVSLDWVLMFAAAGLLAAGALLVWSATSTRNDLTAGDSSSFFKHQLVNIAIGVVLGVMVAATDHRWVRILAPLVYVASIVGLLLVLVMGSTINGSRSWIMLGGLSIQPAEFAKLAVVIGMALLVAERTEGSLRTKEVGTSDVVGMLLIAGLPALLILLQPDLGTMLVLSATVFGVLAVAGVRRTWLLGLFAGAVAVATLAVKLHVLKTYQLDRFMAFTNPDLDPRGAGYNTTQARIAIGNGGLFGQGLFHGSQTRAGFVPEQHTDFIFTVAGEELGLAGAAVLIGLLGVVIWRALVISTMATDVFGRVAAAGIACWFGFQAFQNIGMCLGIMPVTGVPLPFVSYGGSSMFAGMLAIGLLQNIHLRATAELPTRYARPTRHLVAR